MMPRFPQNYPPFQRVSPELVLDLRVLNQSFLNSPCWSCKRRRIDCAADPCAAVAEATARAVMEDLRP